METADTVKVRRCELERWQEAEEIGDKDLFWGGCESHALLKVHGNVAQCCARYQSVFWRTILSPSLNNWP